MGGLAQYEAEERARFGKEPVAKEQKYRRLQSGVKAFSEKKPVGFKGR